jgi:hypothetical protein
MVSEPSPKETEAGVGRRLDTGFGEWIRVGGRRENAAAGDIRLSEAG